MTKDHAKQEGESHLQLIRENRKRAGVMRNDQVRQNTESHLQLIRENKKGVGVMTNNNAKQEAKCCRLYPQISRLVALFRQ